LAAGRRRPKSRSSKSTNTKRKKKGAKVNFFPPSSCQFFCCVLKFPRNDATHQLLSSYMSRRACDGYPVLPELRPRTLRLSPFIIYASHLTLRQMFFSFLCCSNWSNQSGSTFPSLPLPPATRYIWNLNDGQNGGVTQQQRVCLTLRACLGTRLFRSYVNRKIHEIQTRLNQV
jgi:hypothetical protein